MVKIQLIFLLIIIDVFSCEPRTPTTFNQQFQFPDWSGFSVPKPSQQNLPQQQEIDFFPKRVDRSPTSSQKQSFPGDNFVHKFSFNSNPSKISSLSNIKSRDQDEVRPLFIPYSQVKPPPIQGPNLATLAPIMNEYEPAIIQKSIKEPSPSFIPTRKPLPKKKLLRVGKKTIHPSNFESTLSPNSKIIKKMKVKHNMPENFEVLHQSSKIKDHESMTVPLPKTIVKQARFQKLMKILKKIRHKRRFPIKSPLKEINNKEDKSKNYRIVNPDGSIKWGYRTTSGLFKEEIIGVDCVTKGIYGYIDPSGIKREYKYTRGNRCNQQGVSNRRIDRDSGNSYGARGPNGHGYFDYKQNRFIMEDGRRVSVVINPNRRARGLRI